MRIPNTSQRTLARALALASLMALPAAQAQAGAHTWDVNEVFSDATGNIQFVELVEANGTPNEIGVPGNNLTSNTKSFAIPGSPLTPPTSNKFFLLGTAAFAALPGAPPPDALIPAGVLPFFFSPSGDTVTYGPYDSLVFGSLPTDGITSSTGVNSPTNYAGTSGSVNAAPAIPALPSWGLPLLGLLLAAVGARWALGARATR